MERAALYDIPQIGVGFPLPGFVSFVLPVLALVVTGHQAQARHKRSEVIVVAQHPGLLTGLDELSDAGIGERIDCRHAGVGQCCIAADLLITQTKCMATETISEKAAEHIGIHRTIARLTGIVTDEVAQIAGQAAAAHR
ncbi:hypothetical protein D3C76_1111990 [compost metagenome]